MRTGIIGIRVYRVFVIFVIFGTAREKRWVSPQYKQGSDCAYIAVSNRSPGVAAKLPVVVCVVPFSLEDLIDGTRPLRAAVATG